MSFPSEHGFRAHVSFKHVDLFPVISEVACNIVPFPRFPARFSLVEFLLLLFHVFVELMEVDIGKNGGDYTPYKVANFLVEYSTSIPRTQLRPSYGDGF